MINGPFFVFDVESIGLHGCGFAVGWCVVDRDGKELESGYASIDPRLASGSESDREWIAENVLPHLPTPTIQGDPSGLPFQKSEDIYEGILNQVETEVKSIWTLRSDFWATWLGWRAKGATMWADCAWPVEARFLEDCVKDDKEKRNWEGPYPLNEVSTMLIAAGKDPLGTYPRVENELPKHHPTKDARQSARLLIEALDKVGRSHA